MKNGIYTDLSIQDYHANKTHISATQIKLAKRSLKEFHWWRDGKIIQEEKTHFSFGNAFELALLDKEEFAKSVAIAADAEWIAEAMNEKDYSVARNSKKYKELAADFYEINKGMYIIGDHGKESWEAIEHMLESCYQDKVIKALIQNTEYQISVFWTDEESGLQMKTRPDICKRRTDTYSIVNVKTTEDGSQDGFSRDMVKYEYPLQATIEIQGCLQSDLMPRVDNYFWLVVEKVPPYNATIYRFRDEDQKEMYDRLSYEKNKIKRAIDQNLFPGYTQAADNEFGILDAIIPPYYYSK